MSAYFVRMLSKRISTSPVVHTGFYLADVLRGSQQKTTILLFRFTNLPFTTWMDKVFCIEDVRLWILLANFCSFITTTVCNLQMEKIVLIGYFGSCQIYVRTFIVLKEVFHNLFNSCIWMRRYFHGSNFTEDYTTSHITTKMIWMYRGNDKAYGTNSQI
jgi:hypothetical protein